jgi:hypothetical protein
VILPFVNRAEELRELDAARKHGGLLVVYGRRRIGKTRLLRDWLKRNGGWYSQAIEAQRAVQIQQIFEDVSPGLSTKLTPKTWSELLELLALQKPPWILCVDEFPYLTAVDPTLPSRLQAWLDHALPEGCLVILAGSSQRMMSELFLQRAAPLYGRANKLLHVRPMDYAAFCDARAQDPRMAESFEKFACVGGVPKYWEFVEVSASAVELADSLYFDFAPYMEQEPQRILRDEGVAGLNALAVLEAVGRGAERPSEIAARLGTAQPNLSRLFAQLIDASILHRELPYGESARSTKRTSYRISDPTLRFWFRVFSPHQSRWAGYALATKRKLVHDHASTVFEDHCRARFPGSGRYWERSFEFDLVAPDPDDGARLLVAEIKWRRVSASERKQLLQALEIKWRSSGLAARHQQVRFEVLDSRFLTN